MPSGAGKTAMLAGAGSGVSPPGSGSRSDVVWCNKAAEASVSGGDPPALPGRHPEFDNSGSGMRNSRS